MHNLIFSDVSYSAFLPGTQNPDLAPHSGLSCLIWESIHVQQVLQQKGMPTNNELSGKKGCLRKCRRCSVTRTGWGEYVPHSLPTRAVHAGPGKWRPQQYSLSCKPDSWSALHVTKRQGPGPGCHRRQPPESSTLDGPGRMGLCDSRIGVLIKEGIPPTPPSLCL